MLAGRHPKQMKRPARNERTIHMRRIDGGPSLASAEHARQLTSPVFSRLAFGALICVLLFLAGFAVVAAATTRQAATQAENASTLSDDFQQARYWISAEESLERQYCLEPSPAVLAAYHAAASSLFAALSVVRRDGQAADRSLVATVLTKHQAYLNATWHGTFPAVAAHDNLRIAYFDHSVADPLFSYIQSQIDAAASAHHAAALRAIDDLDQTQTWVLTATPVVFVVGMAIVLLLWSVARRYQRSIAEASRREMQRAVEQAADASEAAKAAEAMSAVTAALASSLEPELLYRVILEQAARVLPFDHALIVLYQDGWVVNAACLGEPSVPVGTRMVPIDSGVAIWQALERGETQYMADTAEVPAWHDWPPWIGQYRVRSVIVSPLHIDGVLLGSFEVNSYTPNFYTDRHIQIATDFAERATQAFRNARLFTAEQARVRAAEGLASLRSDFVAAVSHELRTPLTAIVGFGELLQAHWGQMSEERRLERITQIVQAANRQRRLVEDLLLAGQLESAKLRPKREPFSLGDLVRQAVAEVQGSYPGQTIELDGTCDIHVLADAGRTLQILSNLIDNAAKYSPEGTPIIVRWVEEECMAVLHVADLGSGVPDSGRDELFTRFGRLPGSAIRSGRVGTGLGLFLSRGLAEAMGGTLDLEATGPRGSTFRLRLPRAMAVSAGAPRYAMNGNRPHPSQ
jgi:signal transduction histidine kinase